MLDKKLLWLVCTQYVNKDKIAENENAKSWVQKVILEMGCKNYSQMSDEGILEMRVQKNEQRKHNYV